MFSSQTIPSWCRRTNWLSKPDMYVLMKLHYEKWVDIWVQICLSKSVLGHFFMNWIMFENSISPTLQPALKLEIVSDYKIIKIKYCKCNKISNSLSFFSGTASIFFFEAYFSCKNCIRCATIWPEQYCVTAGNFLLPLFLTHSFTLRFYSMFINEKFKKKIAAYVQQVWIWWKTQSYFCGRGI